MSNSGRRTDEFRGLVVRSENQYWLISISYEGNETANLQNKQKIKVKRKDNDPVFLQYMCPFICLLISAGLIFFSS
jgi:hypothetical protein